MDLQAAFNLTKRSSWSSAKSSKSLIHNGEGVLAFFGADKLVKDIDAKAIMDYKLHLKSLPKQLSPATINRKLSAASKILTIAWQIGTIPSVPYIAWEKEAEPRCKVFTDVELEAFKGGLKDIEWNLVCFLKETGLRVREALQLVWEDIENGDRIHVKRTKGNRARTVPVSGRCREILRILDDEREGPFNRVRQSSFNHSWARVRRANYSDDASKDVVPHALRHTFASNVLGRGARLDQVQRLLGHSDIKTTMRYLHLQNDLHQFFDVAQILEIRKE